jgi:hypothetical protein
MANTDNWWEGKVADVDPAGADARNVPDVDKTESAIRAFANAATFGLAPRASALINTGLGKVAPSIFGDQPYSDRLKDYLDADKAAQEQNPKTSFVASAAPQLLQAVATGGTSLARQGVTNTALGALNAAGNAREGEVLKDATTGGLTAGALSVLPTAASSLVNSIAKKYTAGTIAKPLEDLIKNKPKGWQDEIAKYYGMTKKELAEQFGSVERAGKELGELVRDTGKKGRVEPKLSDIPEATQSIVESNIPSFKDIAKQTLKTTGSGITGAVGGAGLNYALGSPVDPTQAALAGAGLNAFRGVQKLGGEAVKKGVMGIAKSEWPEKMYEFGSRNNGIIGAVNQMASQAGGAQATDAGGFRRLTDYLSDLPEEEKRKQAMQMSATPEGRAQSNDDSKGSTNANWWEGRTTD